MRYLLLSAVAMIVLLNAGCRKDSCNRVTITKVGTPCAVWGIKKNGDTYPSTSIPVQYQQEGMVVCAKYELYEDMRACACCGGTWAQINSMSPLPD